MSVNITLEKDVALVLFALLASEQIVKEMSDLGTAEMKSLWALESALEKVMSEPFCPDYSDLLEKARASVVERLGS